ncbi:RluA family pseudouridine synthase [Acidisphaera sp. L21]|uniref:RluA family pseudouridine synthase n=1 Tax=Acidisphaera sp. L21 TaxID=1641851 RepID=UPI00131D58AF|nr:RluA family pseudouridine synthase [Acidisphaera sp. L21]
MSDLPDGAWSLVAESADAGLRLDRFLTDGIGTLSRSRVKSLIEDGHATVQDVVTTDPAATVHAGWRYALVPPPPTPARPIAQDIPLTILFEDRDLLVLDKPAGLVVHPAPGNQEGTLVNALLAHCGDSLPGIGGEKRPGIVHRLDKDTSGVMVVAKTDSAMAALGEAFATRTLERAYLALCWGVPSPTVGEIEGAIGRDPRDRKRMAVVPRGGKAALTRYRVQRAWGAAVALVECRLATGRTHQIRVHMASAGNPLLGDPVYLRRIPGAAKHLPPGIRTPLLAFPRQALHAAVLGFTHPRTGEELRFETPPPADFAGLVEQLDTLVQPRRLQSP